MALNIKSLSYNEFHAIWEALNQYVDNQDDSVEEHEWPASVQVRVWAARKMIEELDEAMAKVAG